MTSFDSLEPESLDLVKASGCLARILVLRIRAVDAENTEVPGRRRRVLLLIQSNADHRENDENHSDRLEKDRRHK